MAPDKEKKREKHVIHCHDNFHSFDCYSVTNQHVRLKSKIQEGDKKIRVIEWHKADIKEKS